MAKTAMKAARFALNSLRRIRRDGRRGARDTLYRTYRIGWRRAEPLFDAGVNVYDRDWDVLVVLDGCRADLLADVAADYDFLPEVGTVRSVGSTSEEWLERTFDADRSEEMATTAYVTANPFSDARLDSADFGVLDEVWRYGWADDLGTVPAAPVTDRAIHHWRTGRHDRLVAHYMQPHFPSVPCPELGSGIHLDSVGQNWESVWDRLRTGDISEKRVREAYRANLEYVLESVSLLSKSIDANRVVITADHGNSFGSWGLYGHTRAPIAALRDVPWCEFVAENESAYVPTTSPDVDDADRPDTEAMLRDLGYL